MHLIFDTETTGVPVIAPLTDPRQPWVMQLAAVLLDDKLVEVEHYKTLVQLPNGIEPHPMAFQAHGITAAQCATGKTREQLDEDFRALAGKAKTFVGHNVPFDIEIMGIHALRLGRQRYFTSAECTMRHMTYIMMLPGKFNKPKWPKLAEAYEFCTGKRLNGAHDALNDVRACADIWRWLQTRPERVGRAEAQVAQPTLSTQSLTSSSLPPTFRLNPLIL